MCPFLMPKYRKKVSLIAKGKYEYWLTPEGLLKLEGWARDGLTDEQIAKNMGINVKTLWTWKNKHDPICNALKRGKEVVNRQVENALLRKALGDTIVLKKPIKTKEVLYENGKRVKETEHIEIVDEEVLLTPDTTAQIFWLKNRKPDKWRDKQDVQVSGELEMEKTKLDNIIRQMRGDG